MKNRFTLYLLGLAGVLFSITGALIRYYFSLLELGSIMFKVGFILVVIYLVMFVKNNKK